MGVYMLVYACMFFFQSSHRAHEAFTAGSVRTEDQGLCLHICTFTHTHTHTHTHTNAQVNGDGVSDIIMGIPRKGDYMRGGACVVFGRYLQRL
jgi:hypothetical protein